MHSGTSSFLFLLLIFAIETKAQTTVVLSAVPQAKVGTSTNITTKIVNIKGIKGPARLTIALPKGWKLENYPGETAPIKQDENTLKVIWLEFPQKDTVNVSTLINLPQGQDPGVYQLKAEFTYLESGKEIKISSTPIRIILKKYFSRF
ncbi:MAG: hypothetical protein WED33_08860 [Bacteroidia bacterium]